MKHITLKVENVLKYIYTIILYSVSWISIKVYIVIKVVLFIVII